MEASETTVTSKRFGKRHLLSALEFRVLLIPSILPRLRNRRRRIFSNCSQGRYRLCTNLIANRDGFSEYSDCDERSLVLAEKLDDDMLSLVEPTNVVLDLLHSAELRPNERVLVLGTGTLGFLTA